MGAEAEGAFCSTSHNRKVIMAGGQFLSSSVISTLCYVLLLLIGSSVSEAKRTNTKIYEDIAGSNACFKRLNATQEIGCSSSLSGDVGVIHLVNDSASLKWIVETGPHSPYVPAVYPDYFTQEVMQKFKDSGRVAGVVLLNNTREKALAEYSTDLKCPNQQFGVENQGENCQWNKPGSGLLFENFEFPIFFVKDEKDVSDIVDCYEKFNKPGDDGSPRDWPLCAIQLQSFMFAAVDTPTCIRRSNRFSLSQTSSRVCDPLGDSNLWATLYPSNQSEPYNEEGSVIIIAAKLDAGSMFDMVVPGADTAVTGFVTLLTCLKQLSALKDTLWQTGKGKIKNVYFMVFQGESFGYIGSSRMVYDMQKGEFPEGINLNDKDVPSQLNLTHIKYFIEIGQVGLSKENEGYFIHEANPVEVSSLAKSIVDKASDNNLTVKEVTQSSTTGLPPASLQSFLKERPDLPGIIITNHEKEFKNKFYNSIFDDAAQLHYEFRNITSVQSKISKLAAAISNSVIRLIDPDTFIKVEPEPDLVDELLFCYLKSANCTLFHKLASNPGLPNKPFDLYVGVHISKQLVTQYTNSLMVYFQGTNLTNITSKDDCKTDKKTVSYYWLNGNCFESTVNASDAHSPAFVIENYDWKSGNYSTWTESVWTKLTARIFLKPSRLHEILTLVSGITLFAVSFVVVGWVNSKADIIFPNRYAEYLPVSPSD